MMKDNAFEKERSIVEDPIQGLTSQEAEARLAKYGRNEIPEKIVRWYTILARQFIGPFPCMIEIACILAAVARKWEDFAIILAMLLINGAIGLSQELKAQASASALKSKIVSCYSVKRDGHFVTLEGPLLVPGDIVFLKGGQIIPADCQYQEGSVLMVDTAVLTGEPFPRKVPGDIEDPPEEDEVKQTQSGENGQGEGKEEEANDPRRALFAGCVVKSGEAYCLVQKTGLNTEIGTAAKVIQANAAKAHRSLFEKKILWVANSIILVTLAVVTAITAFQIAYRKQDWRLVVVRALSLTIASVPVALPLVMNVMMAVGAHSMAKQKAVVTHYSALQEIASMDILCSDKTGTLTTAKITVFDDRIVTLVPEVTPSSMILAYATLACNRDNMDDPIDIAILAAFDKRAEQQDWLKDAIGKYKVQRFYPFDPSIKRTTVHLIDKDTGEKVIISKGLIDKVLKTGEDEAEGGTWVCKDYESIKEQVHSVDSKLSKQGYKTLGVAVSINNEPMTFIGIIPMLDPPRRDTRTTLRCLQQLGIQIKMITGDHVNTARETARIIGLGTNIVPRHLIGAPSEARKQLVEASNGFAQVLPMDKQEIVAILQRRGHIVGMTGDGVNDSPALSQAQIGVAVHGATDAAKSAADILLTEPGLSPIVTAVVESRKIFRRLQTFILYRMAATIQIVTFLTIIIFAYDEFLKAIYIILLALFNDFTVILACYDNAVPGRHPRRPSLTFIMIMSGTLGVLLSAESLIYFKLLGPYASDSTLWEGRNYRQTLVYAQISIAISCLVWIVRTDGPFFLSRPGTGLMLSTLGAMLFVTIICGVGVIVTKVAWKDLGIVWAFDVACLFLGDLVKIGLLSQLQEDPPKAPFQVLSHSFAAPFQELENDKSKSLYST